MRNLLITVMAVLFSENALKSISKYLRSFNGKLDRLTVRLMK